MLKRNFAQTKKTLINKFRYTFIFLIGFWGLTSQIFPQSEIEVVATGSFPFSPNFTKSELKNFALKDAYFKAIEQGVGIFVKKSTSVKNYRDIADVSMTNADGYIKSYNIVDEVIDSSIYSITIKAIVSKGTFANSSSLDQQAYLIFNQIMLGNPRLILNLRKNDKSNLDLNTLSSLLIEPLRKSGYFVDRLNQSTIIKKLDSLKSEENINLNENNFEGDLLLSINIISGEESVSSTFDNSLIHVPVTITVFIIKCNTGEIVYTKSQQITGIGITREQSEFVAIKKYQNNLISDLLQDIPKIFKETPQKMTLYISDINSEDIVKIDSILSIMPNAISKNLIKIDENKATYEIFSDPLSGGSNEIWRFCYSFFPWNVKLLNMSKSTLSLSIKK